MPTESHSIEFQNALQVGDLSAIRKIPKSDLHCHSILGTRIENIERWINAPLPRPVLPMSSLDDMIGFAQVHLYPHTVTCAGFQFTAESTILDAIDDGVTKLEMSMDVRFMELFESFPDGFFAFVNSLKERFSRRIDFRPEIGMSKDRPGAEQIRRATICVDSGLFSSVDLYGNEAAQPATPFRGLYLHAKRKGLKLKAHAGEFGGPEVIAQSLDLLEVDEIQHGISAAVSKPLMARLKSQEVQLNVCPSSNVALGVVKEMSQHPIRTLIDNGVRVTINTDDLTIFGKTVSEEFLHLYQSHSLSAAELDMIRLEGLCND